jgi:Bifunctional DNA primase/polymerase, N-terminal
VSAPLAAALAAAARGWHLIPLRPHRKVPAFPNHTEDTCDNTDLWCRHGHTGWEPRATTNTDRIRRAWSQQAYGVGVACGPSGLVVVDLDTPKPDDAPRPHAWNIAGVIDGHDVFADLCHQVGQPMPLDTYTVATPSGGTHLYYQHPDTGAQLRNTTGGTPGSLGWKVDTRGHGGLVVAAGTTLAATTYRVVHDVDPAPLPSWLAQRLTPRPLPSQHPVRIHLATDRRGHYLHAAITRQLAHIAAAPKPSGKGSGGRNTALYRSAVALGQLVAGGELNEDDVRHLLTRAGLDTGLRPREVARTIASGLKDGARRPRSVAA